MSSTQLLLYECYSVRVLQWVRRIAELSYNACQSNELLNFMTVFSRSSQNP